MSLDDYLKRSNLCGWYFCVLFPAQAGLRTGTLDSRLRGNDNLKMKG
jgi:hypothetical protein